MSSKNHKLTTSSTSPNTSISNSSQLLPSSCNYNNTPSSTKSSSPSSMPFSRKISFPSTFKRQNSISKPPTLLNHEDYVTSSSTQHSTSSSFTSLDFTSTNSNSTKFGNPSFSSTSSSTTSSAFSSSHHTSSTCKISPIEYDNPDTSSKYSNTSKSSADSSGKPMLQADHCSKQQHGASQKKSQLSPIHEGIVHQMYDYLQASQQTSSKPKHIPQKTKPTTNFSFGNIHEEEDDDEDMLEILSSTLPSKSNIVKSNFVRKPVLDTTVDDWKFKKSYTSSEDEEDSQNDESGSDDENVSKNSSSRSYQPTSAFQKLKSNATNAKKHWFKFKSSNLDDEEEDDNSDGGSASDNDSDTTSSTTNDEEEMCEDQETISTPLTFDTFPQKDTDFTEDDYAVADNSLISLDNLDKREMLTLFLLQHVSRQYNPDPNFFISLLRRLHKEGYLTDTRFLDQQFLKQTCKNFMKDVVENWPITFGDNNDHGRTSPSAKTAESFSSASPRLKSASGLSRSESYHSFLSTAGHENVNKQPATLLTSLPLFDSLFFSPSRYKSDFHHKQRIGRGAFGVVFVCKHKIDGHYYAIKKIKFSFRDKNELKEVYGQVIREVRALAALDHPRIVRYNQAWFEPNRNGMHDDEIPHNTEFEDAEETNATGTNHDRSGNTNLRGSKSAVFEHTSREGDTSDSSSGFGASKSPLSYDMDSKQIAKDYPNTISFESSGSGNLVPTSQPTLGVDNIEYPYSPPNNMSYLEFALEQKREPFDAHLLNTLRDMFNPKNQKFEMVLFIQMQLCNPHTLDDWLWSPERSQEKKLDHAEALNFFSQICDGIKHVHSRGVIHRDLKPSNIFLTSDNTIKIGDFGLAKYCLETLSHTRANAEQHGATTVGATTSTTETTPLRSNNNTTTTSIISSYEASMSPTQAIDHTVGVGTYFYASPEQLSHSQYNEKADIYSLGVILFELLHPFVTKTERAFVLKDLKNGIIPETMWTKFPEEMAIVKQCIDENPEKRPTASEIFDRITLLTKKVHIKKSIKSLNPPPHLERKSSFGSSGSSFVTTDLLKEKNRVIEEQQKEIERLKQLLQQASSSPLTPTDKPLDEE